MKKASIICQITYPYPPVSILSPFGERAISNLSKIKSDSYNSHNIDRNDSLMLII